jgi:hypothetical protein
MRFLSKYTVRILQRLRNDKSARMLCEQLLALLFVLLLTLGVTKKSHAQDADEAANIAESPPAAADSKTPPVPEPNQPIDFIAQDITAVMQDDHYQLIDLTLDLGGENERPHQFPIFVSESQKALSMGTFYLLSDVTYNGAQIHALKALAQEMSMLGWHSVVIPAPHLVMVMDEVDTKLAKLENEQANTDAEQSAQEQASEEQAISAQDASAEDSSEQEVTEQSDTSTKPNIQTMLAAQAHQSQYSEAYQQALGAYVTTFLAAVMDATKQPGYQVVFAQGMSAQSMFDASNNGPAVDALIINNVYWPERELNRSLPMRIAQDSTPLLDLISTNDNNWSKATEQARMIKARTEVKAHYRQRKITSVGIPAHVSIDMSREIYGWLTYLGW